MLNLWQTATWLKYTEQFNELSMLVLMCYRDKVLQG